MESLPSSKILKSLEKQVKDAASESLDFSSLESYFNSSRDQLNSIFQMQFKKLQTQDNRIEELQVHTAKQTRNLNQLNGKLKRLAQEMETKTKLLTAARLDAESELEIKNHELRKISTSLNQTRKEHQKSKQRLVNAETQKATAEKNAEILQEKFTQINRKLNKITSEYQGNQYLLTNTQSKLSTLEKEHDDLSEEHQVVKQQLSKFKKEFKTNKQRLQTYESNYKSLEIEKSSFEKNLAEMTKKLKNIEKELQIVHAKERFKQKKEETIDETVSLELNELKLENSNLEKKIIKKLLEINNLKDNLEKEIKSKFELKDQLQSFQEQEIEMKNATEKQIQKLKTNLKNEKLLFDKLIEEKNLLISKYEEECEQKIKKITQQLNQEQQENTQLKSKLMDLEIDIKTQKEQKNTSQDVITTLKQKIQNFRNQLLNSNQSAKKELAEQMTLKNNKIADLEEQFSRLSSMYSDLQIEKGNPEVSASDILRIYITLIEDVFAAAPHGKILFLLHGKKTIWKREEIVKTTGIFGAVLLRSIHDLRNAGMVTYDEETEEVSLTQRIYSE